MTGNEQRSANASSPAELPPARPASVAPARLRPATAALREKIAESPQYVESLTPEAIRQLLNEICAHQMVLEQQSVPLRQAPAPQEAAQKCDHDRDELPPAAFCTLSEQGLILEANGAFAELLGLHRGPLTGQPFSHLILPQDVAKYDQLYKQHCESGQPQSCELRMLNDNSTHFWASLTVTRAPQISAMPTCYLVLRNITERRRAEEAVRVSDAALKAISQGVLITNADRDILSANQAFAEITGYSNAEIIGRNCRFLQGPLTDPQTVEKMRLALAVATEFSGEILNYRKDGSTFWNELTLSPVRDERGHLTHFIGISRDITARKLAENALQASEARLQAILSAIPDLLFEVGLDGRYYGFHSARSELLAAPPDVFLASSSPKCCPPTRQRSCSWPCTRRTTTGIPAATNLH